jgi:hypothetical protein
LIKTDNLPKPPISNEAATEFRNSLPQVEVNMKDVVKYTDPAEFMKAFRRLLDGCVSCGLLFGDGTEHLHSFEQEDGSEVYIQFVGELE